MTIKGWVFLENIRRLVFIISTICQLESYCGNKNDLFMLHCFIMLDKESDNVILMMKNVFYAFFFIHSVISMYLYDKATNKLSITPKYFSDNFVLN